MKHAILQLSGFLFLTICLIYKDIEIRKLKKRLKEIESEIQPTRENYGRCNECGGDLIEWIWNRKGFHTSRVVIACENQPKCKGVL